MGIDAFERREALLDLKEKLLLAEEQRLNGRPPHLIQRMKELRRKLMKRYKVESLPTADSDLNALLHH